MSHRGVCIAHKAANDQPGLLNVICLQEAGYTVRVSTNCVPDLIISKAGTTAAFLTVAKQDQLEASSHMWSRCSTCQLRQPAIKQQHTQHPETVQTVCFDRAEKVSKTFKHSFLLANAIHTKTTTAAACRQTAAC